MDDDEYEFYVHEEMRQILKSQDMRFPDGDPDWPVEKIDGYEALYGSLHDPWA